MAYVEDRVFHMLNFEVSLFSALSYVIDWMVYLILFIIASNWEVFSTTRTTDFSLNDISILHSYKLENETYAPIWFLLVIILFLPLILIIVSCFWFLRNRSKQVVLWDIHSAVLGNFGCCTSQLLLVVILKNISGVPRPDFLSRCDPDDLVLDNGELYTTDICTNVNIALITSGFKSFPSGHSSTIFASQTFLVLFLIGKIKISGKSYFSWKLVISIMYPLIIAFKISLSRVSDNRHRVGDVLFGGFIGIIFGVTFYFMYFTNPFQDSTSTAQPPRKIEISDSDIDGLFGFKLTDYKFEDTNPKTYTESIDDDIINPMSAGNLSPFIYSTLPVRPRHTASRSSLNKSYTYRVNNNSNANNTSRPITNSLGTFNYI